MSLLEFEDNEAEKRHDGERNFLNVVRLIEAVAAIAFVYYWCFRSPTAPVTVELAGDSFWRQIGEGCTNSLTIFLMVNSLIVLVFLLSRQNLQTKPDSYDEYSSAAARDYRHQYQPSPAEIFQHRSPPSIDTISETSRAVSQEVTAVREVKSYRRTRSETAEPRWRERRGEFRRSETATVERETVTARRSRGIDGLSGEEFRTTVETFIMEKRRTLLTGSDAVWDNGLGRERNHWCLPGENDVVSGERQRGAYAYDSWRPPPMVNDAVSEQRQRRELCENWPLLKENDSVSRQGQRRRYDIERCSSIVPSGRVYL